MQVTWEKPKMTKKQYQKLQRKTQKAKAEEERNLARKSRRKILAKDVIDNYIVSGELDRYANWHDHTSVTLDDTFEFCARQRRRG